MYAGVIVLVCVKGESYRHDCLTSDYPFISGILVALLCSKPTIFSSRSSPHFVHLQKAVIPNWHFWSSVPKRRPHALRFVLQDGVTFARSPRRFGVCTLTFLPWVRLAPLGSSVELCKGRGEEPGGKAGVFTIPQCPLSCAIRRTHHLALPTNPQVEWRLLLKNSEPSFVLSRQARSQQALLHSSGTPGRPLGGPGDFWRPDLSLQRKSLTHGGRISVAILIRAIFYSKPSLSARGA